MDSSILRCISKKIMTGNSLRCNFLGIFSSGRMVSNVSPSSDESSIGISYPSPLLKLPSDKDGEVYKSNLQLSIILLLSGVGGSPEILYVSILVVS
ncbi:hypothetical protein ACS0TY_033598 [Phlomoides rotata]